MKMFALPIALVALLLTACGDKPAPASTTAAPADKPKAAAPAAAKPKPEPAGKELAQPMPHGVTIKFPYHFRSDSIEQTKTGESRRVILVEALGGDVATLGDSVRQSMKAAGFRPVAPAEDAAKEEGGAVGMAFVKKDWDGRVRAVLAPAGERKMGHKKATATVTYFWDGPGTAAAAAEPAAAPAAAAAATETPAPAEAPAGE